MPTDDQVLLAHVRLRPQAVKPSPFAPWDSGRVSFALPATHLGNEEKLGKKNKRLVAYAIDNVMQHFAGHEFEDLVVFHRSFPQTARADLQHVLNQILAGAHIYGICREWRDQAKFSDLMNTGSSAVLVGPVQFDEVDIGEPKPLRCVHQAIWQMERQGNKLALLLAQGERGGTQELDLVAPPGRAGLKAAAELLERLEKGLAEARTYRGKILSLEAVDDYYGTESQVRAHRLSPVKREEVILPEKTLRLLERNVHDFINQRPQLRALGMPLKKGLLFYGPPGTGKTHTIRYLASQLSDHTTFLITAEQVGRLRQYMQFARFLQPAIVVLEDVDLIARRREHLDPCGEASLNKLLNEMDGMREDAEILFILTTNRPEQLESALSSRPGRIDQAIEFPLPDEESRGKLVQLYRGTLSMDDSTQAEIVVRTQGGSAAFIKEMMRRAAQDFLRQGAEGPLQSGHLRNALEEMVFDGGSLNLKLLGASQELAGAVH